jgi:hypothetical protein
LGVKKLRDASPCMPTILKPCMHKITQNRSDGWIVLGGNKLRETSPCMPTIVKPCMQKNHTIDLMGWIVLGGNKLRETSPCTDASTCTDANLQKLWTEEGTHWR